MMQKLDEFDWYPIWKGQCVHVDNALVDHPFTKNESIFIFLFAMSPNKAVESVMRDRIGMDRSD